MIALLILILIAIVAPGLVRALILVIALAIGIVCVDACSVERTAPYEYGGR